MVYIYPLSAFPNKIVNSDRLIQEISISSIIVALDHLDTSPIEADIYFKAELSTQDKTTLDTIVSNHSGTPLPDVIPVQNVKVVVEQPKYVDSGNVTQELFCAESIIVDVSPIARSFISLASDCGKDGAATLSNVPERFSLASTPRSCIAFSKVIFLACISPLKIESLV